MLNKILFSQNMFQPYRLMLGSKVNNLASLYAHSNLVNLQAMGVSRFRKKHGLYSYKLGRN